jgi:hypothetical protein
MMILRAYHVIGASAHSVLAQALDAKRKRVSLSAGFLDHVAMAIPLSRLLWPAFAIPSLCSSNEG